MSQIEENAANVAEAKNRLNNVWIWIVVLGYLAYESYEDLKRKSIPVSSLIVCAMLGLVIDICGLNDIVESTRDIFLGIALGVTVILAGKIMKGGLGVGDGTLLICIGILLGGRLCLLVFIIAVTLAAGASAILLAFKKVTIGQSLPFVPFIFGGYIITMVVSI